MGSHDNLVKHAFSDVENARGVLATSLPVALVARIDLSSLRLQPGSFVDEKLEDRCSDLLYSAHISGREALIYFLWEHKSDPEPLTPLQVMRYIVLVAFAAGASSCNSWVEVVIPERASPILHVDEDGERCFDAVIYGSSEEAKRIESALHEVCRSLRDPALKQYLTVHQSLLDRSDHAIISAKGWPAYLDPTKLGTGTAPTPEHVSFHVVAADIGPAGISEICVRGDPKTRAVAVNRTLRLSGAWTQDAEAYLVNTIAHELMHLHSKNATSATCLDLFVDDGSDLSQCHRVSYAAGNAAACSYLARKNDPSWKGWQGCMTKQASNTPGGQHAPDVNRDALGCDKQ